MGIRPLHDRVLVERVQSEEKTASGLISPATGKEKPLEAVVRAVGPGKRNEKGELIPMDVAEGDRVLFGKYSGSEVPQLGDELLILREDEILAVVTD